jgi:hypothetical protein
VAEAHFKAALEIDARRMFAVDYALMLRRAERHAEALAVLEDAVEHMYGSPYRLVIERAKTYAGMDRHRDAAASIQAAIKKAYAGTLQVTHPIEDAKPVSEGTIHHWYHELAKLQMHAGARADAAESAREALRLLSRVQGLSAEERAADEKELRSMLRPDL